MVIRRLQNISWKEHSSKVIRFGGFFLGIFFVAQIGYTVLTMEIMNGTLLALLLILFVGLVVPEFFRKLRLPWATSLILLGAVLGPHGTQTLHIDPTIEFFGFLGLTFLMLMAGLETRVDEMRHSVWKVVVLAAANGIIPAVVGFFIARGFGYDMLPSLLVGVIFVSSSIAIIIPSLKSAKLFNETDGQLIVSAVIVEDIFSLILLAFLLQSVAPITTLPLWLYFSILFASLFALKFLLPKLSKLVLKKTWIFKKNEHEDQIRFVIVVLMGVLLYFSILGVHPIVAAFLVGLLLSGVITSKGLFTKLHTLGYGLFVPVFFFIIGMQMDLSVFASVGSEVFFLIAIVFASIFSKILSGFFAGTMIGMKKQNAAIFGVASTVQLTTSLAATQAAFSIGIIDQTLLTSIVLLSVITTIFSPILLRFLAPETFIGKMKK